MERSDKREGGFHRFFVSFLLPRLATRLAAARVCCSHDNLPEYRGKRSETVVSQFGEALPDARAVLTRVGQYSFVLLGLSSQ